jgi:predicted ArsR family transcriptional regulator
MSIQQRLRDLLREGPLTAPEAAVTLGITQKQACARLRSEESSGRARRIGVVTSMVGGRPAILFEAA